MDDMILKMISERITENCRGRTLVVWGKGTNSEELKSSLESKRLNIGFWVDSDEKKVDQCQVKNCDFLDGKREDYYVCVSLSLEFEEIRKELRKFGYEEDKDYCYIPERRKPIHLYDIKDYSDQWGNRIEGNLAGGEVYFTGTHSVIKIGEGCSANHLVITMGNGGYLSIGDHVNFNNGKEELRTASSIVVDSNAKSTIENGVRLIGPGRIVLRNGSIFSIGRNTMICKDYSIRLSTNTFVKIGHDCLFSLEVAMWSDDGHPIYDIMTGEEINFSEPYKKGIIIGDHVWLGYRTVVLYNTQLGDGCVVGANSFIKKKYPNNCLIAGNPPRILRKNIAWSRKKLLNGLEDLEQNYRRLTDTGKYNDAQNLS